MVDFRRSLITQLEKGKTPMYWSTLYYNTMLARNQDIQTLWSINNFFMVIHGVGLTFVYTQLTGGVYAFGCLFGFLVAIAWALIVVYLQIRIWAANRKLAELEEQEASKYESAVPRVFSDPGFLNPSGPRRGVNVTMYYAIVLLAIYWLGLLLYPFSPPRWQF